MKANTWIPLLVLLLASLLRGDILDPYYERGQKSMIKEIVADVEKTKEYIGRSSLGQNVLEALAEVPRHKFVSYAQRLNSYENRPLPIGYGQTISQPYIVAVMTDLLDLKSSDRVLEIGTGSGYQAAILSKIAREVHTIEIIEPLAKSAKERLRELGYGNVQVYTADGYFGIKEKAPFDAIIVTAAAGHVPPPLIKQLKRGGSMIIPVGDIYYLQHLVLIKKDPEGRLKIKQLMPVAFVPLTRER